MVYDYACMLYEYVYVMSFSLRSSFRVFAEWKLNVRKCAIWIIKMQINSLV
jgi:hypothetical protein